MKLLKLIKEDKQLLFPNNPTVYMLAIEYGWNWELIDSFEDAILNDLSDIN